MPTAHKDHLIDLVDEKGSIVSQKIRAEVSKANDLYHGVYVLVITPNKDLVLSKIPKRDDLPNLYASKLGVTVATIRRHNESKDTAAIRALTNEIYAVQPKLNYLGNVFAVLPDGHRLYISAYYILSDVPTQYSQKDIERFEIISPDQLDAKILNNKNALAPTLSLVWDTYRGRLPV